MVERTNIFYRHKRLRYIYFSLMVGERDDGIVYRQERLRYGLHLNGGEWWYSVQTRDCKIQALALM